jgi:hypothetical protein
LGYVRVRRHLVLKAIVGVRQRVPAQVYRIRGHIHRDARDGPCGGLGQRHLRVYGQARDLRARRAPDRRAGQRAGHNGKGVGVLPHNHLCIRVGRGPDAVDKIALCRAARVRDQGVLGQGGVVEQARLRGPVAEAHDRALNVVRRDRVLDPRRTRARLSTGYRPRPPKSPRPRPQRTRRWPLWAWWQASPCLSAPP